MFRIKNILLPALIGCCLLCGCSDNQDNKKIMKHSEEISNISDEKKEQNNETTGQPKNDSSENSLFKDDELPYCVYGSPIAEYNGVMYGYPFENYPNLEGKYANVCNIAFYGNKVYYSRRSTGTSGVSSALYSCNLDGSDKKLLDDCEFIDYDRVSYDCSAFVICEGILYYDHGLRYINLENNEKGMIESDTLDEKFCGINRWRYHNPTKTWYYLNYDNQYIVKIADGVEKIVRYQMRGEQLDALDAITEDALYFESRWSEAQKKYLQGMSDSITDEDRQQKAYLWKMDLETGQLTEIDARFIAGAGNYYGH